MKTRTSRSILILTALVSACGGCVEEPQNDDATEERTWTVTSGWGCPTCGFKNSPYLGKHPLTEFSIDASVPSTFSLKEIETPAGVRHPVVFGTHRIEAHTPTGVQHGSALLNWKLIFKKKGGGEIPVRIMAYEQHPDWADGAPIDTYGLAYQQGVDGAFVSVCPGLSIDDTTIVFTPGEVYLDASKTVVPNQPAFVTVACRGHAVAKLKFLGHDPNDNYGSQPENRQAALKMLTADYCGNGISHTTVGQPLEWQDELGLFSLSWTPKLEDLEARWDENGAVCLNEPRSPTVNRNSIGCSVAWCAEPADDVDGNRWASYHAP